jgi:hypothetical protein
VSLAVYKFNNHKAIQDGNPISLTNQAQIDFFGHTPDGGSESNNGIRVKITSSCNGASGLSASFEPEGQSQFYQNQNNATDDDNAHIQRFQDTSCNGSPSSTGDQDTCEHMKSFYVSSAPTGTPKVGNTPNKCHNGECLVEFVVQ